ncbi:DUF481 domain-containing protein [Vibrio sp. SS-MA-C1-2]|uniref:DUF481 domain-containing protein n=1 Tax=Vibrio sp. SS-MA-C1-2 TaxID=2908646 RepID=UPI001F17B1C4|nr:DUF481 domain-containing protein [Vibrio sp. SS-MA-C1-2]UJF19545.1 DUF481 domain-containing protein [Vibrio sp. SS-MA-C1-2]
MKLTIKTPILLAIIAAQSYTTQSQATESQPTLTEDAPTEIESPWGLEVELGYQSQSGNNDSRSINSRLAVDYHHGLFNNSGEFKYYQSKSDGIKDNQRNQFKGQTSYYLTERSRRYLFANIDYLNDRFGSYYKNMTISSGVGFQVLDNDKMGLQLEFGPGFRHQEPNLDEIDDDDLIYPDTVNEGIAKGTAKFSWNIVKNINLDTDLIAVYGESNTSFENGVDITTAVTESFAIKLSNTLRYQTWVPDGLDNKDNTTTINLLYQF